ncbi:MAG: outer membrane protein assembly factor BamD [Bryobacteraceae bacterium]|nr:outer membrane protein assembly factor BamD [Bryobacteraceae bacterium]
MTNMRHFALLRQSLLLVCVCLALLSGCRKKKYENPITKDTQQPDKVLFDKSVADIERGRYEVARLTLQTLINTYDTSEYLAKAKLAIADSWFREGGSNGLAQAEAEYKDFILFYPTMEESAESQEKICMIHYKQMEKPDRDSNQAQRAEEECRTVLNQFPNSKFAPRVAQLLRNIQEAIAEGEFRVGAFYHKKGSFPAAANRLQTLTDHYPIYSQADEALFQLGDSYSKMGNRFRERAGQAYSRIVKEYPLSARVDEAKQMLKQMEMPVPEADPAAAARMKYELENRTKASMLNKSLGFMSRGPDTRLAAKSGTPAMTPMRPAIPVSVPVVAPAAVGGTTDVTVQQVGNSSALDNNPDARQIQPAAPATNPDGTPAATAPATPAPPVANEPLPANRQAPVTKKKKTPKPPKAPKQK